MTDEEKQRKNSRFMNLAKAAGVPNERISKFLGGITCATGGGGATAGGTATGELVSPETTYGVEDVGKAESERERTIALVSLRRDLNSWNYKTFKDLIGRYAGRLPSQEIMEEYNAFHSKPGTWGPFQEPEEEVQKWTGEAIKREKGTSEGGYGGL